MEIKDVIELIKAVSDNGLAGFKIEQLFVLRRRQRELLAHRLLLPELLVERPAKRLRQALSFLRDVGAFGRSRHQLLAWRIAR